MNNVKYLWVFGNAVQDITVEVDMERLSRLPDENRNLIQLTDQGPQIRPNLWLKAQIGSRKFGVKVELPNVEAKDNTYLLNGGEKYTLQGSITDSEKDIKEPCLFLPCENLSWGGGGTNVITFLRALTPSSDVVPIRYNDIAMIRSMPEVIGKALKVLGPKVNTLSTSDSGDNSLVTLLNSLYKNDPVQAELITRQIAAIAADYSPEHSLAVYLASLSVESVLYRPETTRFRRNWVFSRFRGASREVNNKIILKGNFIPLSEEEEDKVVELLRASKNNVGAILINSLKDGPLFRAAYSVCKEKCKDENFVAGLAVRGDQHNFLRVLIKKRRRR